MKKPCSEMFCLRNQDITDAKAFFLFIFYVELRLAYHVSLFATVPLIALTWCFKPGKHISIQTNRGLLFHWAIELIVAYSIAPVSNFLFGAYSVVVISYKKFMLNTKHFLRKSIVRL